MKKTIAITAAAAAMLAVSPAAAQSTDGTADRAGTMQAKVLMTGVLPDGEIDTVNVDAIGVPAGTQTTASDNVVPTLAIEYFLTNNLSIETICCVTSHTVSVNAGALDGAELVENALLLPATVTAKAHADLGPIKPYIGAGVAYFIWLDQDVAADAAGLGATDVNLSDEFGAVLQAGVDIPLGDSGFGISLDAKRYFIDTTATFYAGSATALETEHNLDPWVVSGGVTFRF
ncbi:OmpW/AlkL family protein [Pseudoblastomonas halimionae]|uniref:Outer membrane beta-barrel protein n=1 Tax=Alteriqipengyuania halimionae TaxID=1926630 RepID=A0A6I4TZ62_9SPHN|nr:OmpW family outer membrane protein [Alteriqipengyuania halimionae]MXP08990.1 hypothetical protein [Alteriqipengyuania halimionae]